MSRQNDSKPSGSIRRNSPVNSSQQFNKFSQQFLKQRLKNRQKIQNRMKDLNTKLYSSQSDLIKQSSDSPNPQTLTFEPKLPRSPERKYYEQQKKEPTPVTQDNISQLLKQLKQQYQKQISGLKRTHEMKLKAMDQVVNGKDKIIKQLEIQNGVLRTQMARLEGCLKSGRLL